MLFERRAIGWLEPPQRAPKPRRFARSAPATRNPIGSERFRQISSSVSLFPSLVLSDERHETRAGEREDELVGPVQLEDGTLKEDLVRRGQGQDEGIARSSLGKDPGTLDRADRCSEVRTGHNLVEQPTR